MNKELKNCTECDNEYSQGVTESPGICFKCHLKKGKPIKKVKFIIEEYDEVWEFVSCGTFPDGSEYLNFKVVDGKNKGSEISHYHKEEFIKLCFNL